MLTSSCPLHPGLFQSGQFQGEQGYSHDGSSYGNQGGQNWGHEERRVSPCPPSPSLAADQGLI